MGYTSEAIAPQGEAPVLQAPSRPDRVVEPYRQRPGPKVGQNAISETPAAAPAAEPTVQPTESVSLSPAAAALARKEAKFREAQAALKTKEAELEKERNDLAELKGLREKLNAKDYSAIEGMVPYDEYTNYHVNKLNGTSPEAKAIDEVKSEVERLKKVQADDIAKRFDAAVNERRTAVKRLVETDAKYSSIKELAAEEAVVQHILDTWEHDNIDLSPEQAALEVEEIILERAKKWSSLSKVRPSGEPVVEKSVELPPLKSGVKTLTNNMNATGEISRPKRSFQGMSDSERWAEARKRAEEKLIKKG
jgi:hypothetical protein